MDPFLGVGCCMAVGLLQGDGEADERDDDDGACCEIYQHKYAEGKEDEGERVREEERTHTE